jgi:hypothetical protein
MKARKVKSLDEIELLHLVSAGGPYRWVYLGINGRGDGVLMVVSLCGKPHQTGSLLVHRKSATGWFDHGLDKCAADWAVTRYLEEHKQ